MPPRLARVLVAAGLMLGLGACRPSPPSADSIASAEQRVGVSPELARCVARAAVKELTPPELRTLVADPGVLPASLDTKVTRLAADCAVSTAPPFASTTSATSTTSTVAGT